jgi:hypothetical protein
MAGRHGSVDRKQVNRKAATQLLETGGTIGNQFARDSRSMKTPCETLAPCIRKCELRRKSPEDLPPETTRLSAELAEKHLAILDRVRREGKQTLGAAVHPPL